MMKVVSVPVIAISIFIGAYANVDVLKKIGHYDNQRLQEINSLRTLATLSQDGFKVDAGLISDSAQYIVEKRYGSPAITYQTIWARHPGFDPAMLTSSDRTSLEKQAVASLQSLRKRPECKGFPDAELLALAMAELAGRPQELLCRLQREGDALNPATYYSFYNFALNSKIYEIGYAYSHYRRYLHEEVKHAFIWIISTALIALIVLPLVIRNSLRIPLNHLLDGVKQVDTGDLKVVVPIKTEDEIGLIA